MSDSANKASTTPITDALTAVSAELAKAKSDLDAQIPLVRAMETATTPPQPGQPSRDGAKASDTTTVLVTDDGTQWRLQGAAGAYTIQFAPKGTTNWTAAGNTAQVTLIEKWKGACCQTSPNSSGLSQPGWWSGLMATPTAFGSWTPIPGDPSASTPPVSGLYQIGPNGIIDPTGKPWRANGINCLYRQVWGNGQPDLARFSSAALRRGFPKLNLVRFADLFATSLANSSHPASDATVRNWVTDLTSNGIVVYAEVHYTGNYASGQAMTDACAWLTEWANVHKGNPMVWYGTQNEPHGDGAGISRMMRTMYNAVRQTGAGAPVLFACGNPGDEVTHMDPTQFADTTNTGFDQHYYGWMPANGIAWSTCVAQCAAFRNQQGPMTVLCLETGDSTDGSTRDGNWQQVLQQSLQNGPGSACWYANWDALNADRLLAAPFDFSALTDYGAVVRDAMH